MNTEVQVQAIYIPEKKKFRVSAHTDNIGHVYQYMEPEEFNVYINSISSPFRVGKAEFSTADNTWLAKLREYLEIVWDGYKKALDDNGVIE